MSNGYYTHRGSGGNYLCMHPEPEWPEGMSEAQQIGALLFGVEYKNTGAIDKHHNHDAGCVVCEHKTASSVYVQWGRKTCTNGHHMEYFGLIMSTLHNKKKSEFICVSWNRMTHATSDSAINDGGTLYTTEWDVKDVSEYKKGNELSCAVCSPQTINTVVYTRWGSQTCPSGATELYKSFMATSPGRATDTGGGANILCMHPTPEYPGAATSALNGGARLSVLEYMDTGAVDKNQFHDAGCVVCQREEKESVYTQWGRKTCSNGHYLEYYGVIMASRWTGQKNEYICVDWERAAHAASNNEQDAGVGLLYTTEMEAQASLDQYGVNKELSCAVCSSESLVYTRWGRKGCIGKKLYAGFIASSRHFTDNHKGDGYNYLCMHPEPEWPEGMNTGDQNGALLMGVEYQNTGAVDKNQHKDAVCVVCQQDYAVRVPYVQWGRKTCSNGHHLEYYGVVMASLSTQHKSEWICVDWQRSTHKTSNDADEKAGRLYTAEMRTGASSADEAQYGNRREISCAVCS